MAQLTFLNERSHPIGNIHPAVAGQLLTGLIAVLLRVKQILPRLVIITAEPIPTLRLGDNYSVSVWLNESGINRERARFLLSLGQQAPFRIAKDLFGDPDPGATVYRYAGQTVEGIGLAHLYGGLPISFCVGEEWRVATIMLSVEQLLENGEQFLEVETPHASLVEHVETHRTWLTSIRQRNIENALDLWARRTEIFTHVEFGPGIESDLAKLQQPAFLQVVQYLCRMDSGLEQWNPATQPAPDYPPNTTDESESRKSLCYFPAQGGGREQFTWHGRYTPGAGRIHFRLQASPKRVIVGYIGQKVGI